MIFQHFFLITPLSFLRTCNGNVEEPRNRSNLFAITKFHGLEDYYLQLRKQRLEPPVDVTSESTASASTSRQFRKSPSKADKSRAIKSSNSLTSDEDEWGASVKKRICENIFRSDFFDAREEDWMDLDNPVVYQELKRRKNKLFKEIFPKRIIRRRLKLLMCASPHHESRQQFHHVYVNPLKSSSISIRGDVQTEKVFICPVKKRNSSREIEPYFVSEEYNVNAAYRRPNAPFIVGRFIFHRNERKQLVIDALAEESAEVSPQISAEIKYVELKKDSPPPPVDDPKRDPIRRLTAVEQLRLCATIFSSVPFAGRVKYLSTSDNNVSVKSEEKNVSFVDEEVRETAPQKMYQEWTVACEPLQRKTELIASTSYVSRADGFNRVFVYASSVGKHKYLYPEYYFTNVGVIAI